MFFVERYENNEFDIMFGELNVDFSTEEIGKSINQLKTNKSAGPDYLINEFFIHGKQFMANKYLYQCYEIFLICYLKEDIFQKSGRRVILYHCIKKVVYMM